VAGDMDYDKLLVDINNELMGNQNNNML